LQKDGPHPEVFLYDSFTLLEQYDNNQLTQSIIPDTNMDGPFLLSSNSVEYYLFSDLNGSIRYSYEGTQRQNFYTYDEFGNLSNSLIPGDNNPFRFMGKCLLDATGKYDLVFRTYDPKIGRFLQRDPMGFVDGTNMYTFVHNNPLVFRDRLGLEGRSEHARVGAATGAEIAYKNPTGFTLAIPDSFDKDKIRAYKQRIQNPNDRGVGIRSRPEGAKTSTGDIRRRFKYMRDEYEASLPGGRRPRGTDIDHTVELQHIIRGNSAPRADTVRRKDHRVQDLGTNRSQGSLAQHLNSRRVEAGDLVDTSAGGIAREMDLNKFWNRVGFRTGMRYFGIYNSAGGTFATLSSFGDDIREGNWGNAALSGSGSAGGLLELGGMLSKSGTLMNAGRWLGAPAAIISSGVLGVQIGTNLYENYVDKERSLDAGSWVEEKTGSRILGGVAAAAVAVEDAIASAPEAAYDYAAKTWTVDPDEIDWGKSVKPWRWFD
jgi:RHS repeat-associated protein